LGVAFSKANEIKFLFLFTRTNKILPSPCFHSFVIKSLILYRFFFTLSLTKLSRLLVSFHCNTLFSLTHITHSPLFIHIFLSFYISLPLSISLFFISITLTLTLTDSFYVSPPLSVYIYLSISLSLFFSFSLSFILSLPLPLLTVMLFSWRY
jgi:hypothetical protein